MPDKEKGIGWPAWVEDIPDICVRRDVKEALVARDDAIVRGALTHRPCAQAFRSGERTLDRIAAALPDDPDVAAKKATAALRKFTVAAECAHPTATRPSRPPHREA